MENFKNNETVKSQFRMFVLIGNNGWLLCILFWFFFIVLRMSLMIFLFHIVDAAHQILDLRIVVLPLGHNALRSGQFGFLRLWVIAEIDDFRLLKSGVTAPRLAPEPLLWQRFYGNLMDHIVRQILIQIGQTVRVLTESLRK